LRSVDLETLFGGKPIGMRFASVGFRPEPDIRLREEMGDDIG